jgi:Ca2+-binding RTX toxin-like protein
MAQIGTTATTVRKEAAPGEAGAASATFPDMTDALTSGSKPLIVLKPGETVNLPSSQIKRVFAVDIDLVIETASGDRYLLPQGALMAMSGVEQKYTFANGVTLSLQDLFTQSGTTQISKSSKFAPTAETPDDAPVVKIDQGQIQEQSTTSSTQQNNRTGGGAPDAPSVDAPSVASQDAADSKAAAAAAQSAGKAAKALVSNVIEAAQTVRVLTSDAAPSYTKPTSVMSNVDEGKKADVAPLATKVSFELVNDANVQTITHADGSRTVKGAGGTVASSTEASTAIQFAPQTLTGTELGDTIYGHGDQFAATGENAKVLLLKFYNFIAVDAVRITGIPDNVRVIRPDGTLVDPAYVTVSPDELLNGLRLKLVYAQSVVEGDRFDVKINVAGATVESTFNKDYSFIFQYKVITKETDLVGGSINDVPIMVLPKYPGNVVVNAGSGDDVVYAGEGNDSISGEGGNDTLFGGLGNDSINGGAGADSMMGGAGDDVYRVDNLGDVVVEHPDEGIDTVAATFDYTLADNLENLRLLGTAVNGVGNALDNVITGSNAGNTLDGADGNDTLIAGSGADSLVGGFGDDSLVGNLGDDTLEGGDGADILDGGNGFDYANYQSSPVAVYANLNDQTNNTGDASGDIYSGIEGLIGSEFDDKLLGDRNDNILMGMSGNDTLDGGLGMDTLIGGVGNDTYLVDSMTDHLVESPGEGRDTVISTVDYTLGSNLENLVLQGVLAKRGTGNTLANLLQGNVLDNLLDGKDGNDTLLGDAGNDTLIGGAGADSLVGGEGVDTASYRTATAGVFASLTVAASNTGDAAGDSYSGFENMEGSAYADTLAGDSTANVLYGLDGDDSLFGAAGMDTLYGGEGNDTLNGGSGADSLIGGAGNDTYIIDNSNDVVLEDSDEGIDTVITSADYTVGNFIENLVLTGTSAVNGVGSEVDNLLTGNDIGNLLSGLAGNDTLIGNGGDDTLIGGTGADSLIGGTGSDTASYRNAAAPVFASLAAVASNTGEAAGDSYTGIENLEGSSLNDSLVGDGANNILYGLEGNDSLFGGAGADTLYGGAGNDTLDGGTDADVMAGGEGDDTYYVDNAADVVVENTGGGIDTVVITFDYTLTDPNVENLILTGTAKKGTGSAGANIITANANFSNTLDGGAGNDTLIGSANADVLDGGSGADSLIGGAGDDLYIVDNTGDVIVELAGGGTDTVQSSINYTLGANLERLTLTGTTATQGTGNALNNIIVANNAGNLLDGADGADSLVGGTGSDSLMGGTGNDTLDGGTGNDSLNGGSGHDSLIGGDGNDTLQGGAGNNTLDGGAGSDMASYSGSAAGIVANLADTRSNVGDPANDVWISIENLEGSAFADELTGNNANNILIGLAGNDTLDGGAGADTMIGGEGNDVYFVDDVGDVIIEASSTGGTDAVYYRATPATVGGYTSYTLSANVENIFVESSAGRVVITGSAANNIIVGNDEGDTLLGAAGADSLVGGAGDDSLDGGAGNDTLVGGAGDDTYIVDSASDVIVELANEGTDAVFASASTVLSANIENLTLTGTAAINGTGNALDNVITGNSGANSLAGGDGSDSLSGGDGNDTLDGGAGVDTLLGGNGNDILRGGAGADVLDGGAGTDTASYSNAAAAVLASLANSASNTGDAAGDSYTAIENLQGSGFNDTLIGDNNANVITGLAGADSLLGAGGADSLDGGDGHDYLDGGAGNDTLVGGAGNDTLVGGAGVDSMVGGAGNDVYYVDSATDVVVEAAGRGSDTLYVGVSSFALTSTTEIENIIVQAEAGAATITGSDTNNWITANNAGDSLVGAGGNDTLVGGGGSDTLVGGTGSDSLVGGGGNDWASYSSATQGVQADLSGGNLGANDAAGDTFNSVENLIGSAYADILYGSNVANTLQGGGGDDTLAGGGGADVLDGGTGTDTASYRNATTGGVLASLASPGSNTGDAQGDTYTSIENIEGSDFADTLVGDGNVNQLWGRAGNDSLVGGSGNDTLDGGVGNDTLDGGVGDDYLVGGEGNDRMSDTSGNNTFDMTSGQDSATGGAGNDTFIVQDGVSIGQISAAGGTDTLRVQGLTSGGSFSLSQFSAQTSGVEIVDVADGIDSEVRIALSDLTAMGYGAASTLKVKVDGTDTFSFSGVDHTVPDTATAGHTIYRLYDATNTLVGNVDAYT